MRKFGNIWKFKTRAVDEGLHHKYFQILPNFLCIRLCKQEVTIFFSIYLIKQNQQNAMIRTVRFQKISIPTPRKAIGNFEGKRGFSKAKMFKGKYEAKLEFPWEGWGERVSNQEPWVWIFSGTTVGKKVILQICLQCFGSVIYSQSSVNVHLS